jgi:methionine aminotransferase
VLAERAFVVSSFGKTYHVTGWKVGYVAAPAALTAEFRKVHQYNVFTVNTPMQHGLAGYMARSETRTWSCRPSTSASATCSAPAWRGTRFSLLPADGTYFQCVATTTVIRIAGRRSSRSG